ncbi:MAG: alanine--glyoxylate aminotransferase family protein [Acidobacteria bacterium]|nr:alanine--glyoxylate aminotransferase family protein [Acidobacteriota bacterium]
MSDKNYSYFQPPDRILLGPGPSAVDPAVLLAMAAPTIGHMDPATFDLLADIHDLLREVFGTTNDFTLTISGTGSAGMETAVVNFVRAGTKVCVFANGYFSDRLTDMCRRQKADIVRLEKPWGEVFSDDEAAEFIARERPEVVAFIHAETSTGALQDPAAICKAAHDVGALVIGDCVTSLGGMPVEVDKHGIDIVYSGTQKCLGVPPGLSPMTLSTGAVEALKARDWDCVSWYLDLKLIHEYWGKSRRYHHTTPVNMIYALREGLRLIHEETLEARFARHRLHHRALVAGFEALGMKMHVAEQHRLWTLHTPLLPEGVDDAELRKLLLETYGIEVLGGFGPLAGKVLRVGLMGSSSTRRNIVLLLAALESGLHAQGHAAAGGVQAAEAVLAAG